MQLVVLGSEAAKEPLDQFIQHATDEVEVVDSEGTVMAYVLPAPRPGDATYAKFEAIFQSHGAELQRRRADLAPGISTAELLRKLHALKQPAG